MTVVFVGSSRQKIYPDSTIILHLLRDNWNFVGIADNYPKYKDPSNPANLPIPFLFSKNDFQANIDFQIKVTDYDADSDMGHKLGGGTNYMIQNTGRVSVICMVRTNTTDNEPPIQLHNMTQRVKDIIRERISNIGNGIVDADIATEANLLHAVRVEKTFNPILTINRENPFFEESDIATYSGFWKTEIIVNVMYFLHVTGV